MKRLITLLTVVTFVMASLTSFDAAAQDTSVMTDAHIERIRMNCGDAQATLQRLHASDAPLRVNRGQLYDSISTKLMTRLNSRLVINKLDASVLVKITSEYDKALSSFRTNYKKYDDQMSAVLSIDCRRQPVAFYDGVASARQLRGAVHGDVSELRRLIVDYQKAFDEFSLQYKSHLTGKEKGV